MNTMKRDRELLKAEMATCQNELEEARKGKCDGDYNYWYGKYKGLEYALSIMGKDQ